jgi:hypothetical protein
LLLNTGFLDKKLLLLYVKTDKNCRKSAYSHAKNALFRAILGE